MDFDSLKTQVSNLTLYDLKAGVRKVQNAVMNLTEMESKVREATNADPWGAPSSLMMEIAQGTHNYQQLNEIMPMIYKRFTDKTAEEWRQIYKSLQLLEFLVKNGSERVIDDARSHLSLLRMLRQFHYIDPNGKDQGINVRNRSAELAKLLSDVDTIRTERKKARANKNKYGGVEGGGGLGGGVSSGSRYGGFGSETGGFGGYQGEVYGDGGGFGGQDPDYGFTGTQKRGDNFEEYDEGEEGTAPARVSKTTASTNAAKREPSKQKQKEPEADLFDFADEPSTTSSRNATVPASSVMDDFGTMEGGNAQADDDFDDFQSAPAPVMSQPANTLAALSPPPKTSTTTSATQFAAPKPLAAGQAASFNNLFTTTSPAPFASSNKAASPAMMSSPPPQTQMRPQQPAGPNYYTSVPAAINSPSGLPTSAAPRPNTMQAQPSYASSTSAASLGKPVAKSNTSSAAAGDAFGSLWNSASSKAGVQSKTPAGRGQGLADMAKQKSAAGIWGATTGPLPRTGAMNPTPNSASSAKPAAPLGNGLDDLLG